MKYKIQHEFDDDPTYVVDQDDNTIVQFPPTLPWQKRLELAKLVVDTLNKDDRPTLEDCEFTSVWDDGSTVITPCKYNPATGEVTPESSDASPEGTLEREFITFSNGDEVEVCPNCHEYVTKVAMVPGVGKTLNETRVCTNPNCG